MNMAILVFCIVLLACFGLASPTKYTEAFFEQTIDHFNFNPNIGTYKQRYLYNDDYALEENDAIVFYTGNEGAITEFWDNTGFAFDLAQHLGAVVVFGEHRYYGKSMPFGNESFSKDKVGYLAVEQALADYAVLITNLKWYQHGHTAVVAIGGSYGGFLSAWMRFKYPNIVTCSLAASAPLFIPYMPRNFFFEAVTKDYQGADARCPDTARQAYTQVFDYASQGAEGLSKLTKIFRLKNTLTKDKVNHFLGWTRNAFTMMAMMDYPYPAKFLTPGGLPGHPVNVSCKMMLSASSPIQGLAQAVGLAYNGTNGTLKYFDIDKLFVECADPTGCGTGPESLAWDYQACTELNMPGGSNNETDMFPVIPWTKDDLAEYCKQRWGLDLRPNWYTIQFWGKDINSATNIIFSNGDLDPWAPAGVYHPTSETLVPLLVRGGAHHLDLRGTNAKDPPSVTTVRLREISILKQWIKDARQQREKQS